MSNLAERIAYWFFRLNGCMTTQNFILHPDSGEDVRTEVDLIAVRFPHRRELRTADQPMEDHEMFLEHGGLIQAYLVDASTGTCKLSSKWRNRERRDLEAIIDAMGFFDVEQQPHAIESLYENALCECAPVRLQFVAVGRQKSPDLYRSMRSVEQLTWDEILSWMYQRLSLYRLQKKYNRRWDQIGITLQKEASRKSKQEFVDYWLKRMRIRVAVGA